MILSKSMKCNKNNYYKTLAFWLQKPPTYSICEKYMVEMSCNAFMSKIRASFERFPFSVRCVPQFGGEDKTRICFAKTYIYYFVITSFDL
jgi:hypothetical protein